MGRVFISYRRTQGYFVDRLASAIEKKIDGTVFVDITSIREADFENVIAREVRACDVFLLIVTPDTFAPDRIFDEADWVRREIALALTSDGRSHSNEKPIALVLVEGCPLPRPSALPDDIRPILTKYGIEFRRQYFDQGIDLLVDHCCSIAPDTIKRKYSGQTATAGHVELRLKQGVREAIEQLTAELLRSLQSSNVSPTALAFNAWTASEGLLSLLYTDSSAISSRAISKVDEAVLSQLAYKLTSIDKTVIGGGIPAAPDFQIIDKGVIDSTAKVVSALSALRLYMYRHNCARLTSGEFNVELEEVGACISRLCDWIRGQQNPDSGWGLWKGTVSRTTATAYAIMACLDAGASPDETFLLGAQNWLQDKIGRASCRERV